MAADEQSTETVTVTDLNGTEFEVPVGLDGVNPVSPNNPPLKAIPEPDREAALEAREAEVKFAEDVAEAAGAGEGSASTNKEDSSPVQTAEVKSDDKADEKPAAKKTTAAPKK